MSPCKTPGAVYSISVFNPAQVVSVSVELPHNVPRLNEAEAASLEIALHRAVEQTLAPLFNTTQQQRV